MILFSTKIYDKRDDYDFELVNFPFETMEFKFLNSCDLLEHLAMLQTSTPAINFNSETS